MDPNFQILAWGLGPQELILLAVFGLLIFGKRLPEVGKSLGKSIVEFKKGLHGIEDEINTPPPRQADILPPPQKTEAPTESRAEEKVKVEEKREKETVPPDNH